jgi:hypothetical protein
LLPGESPVSDAAAASYPATTVKPLSGGELAAAKATGVATAMLGLLGFAISFSSVARVAASSFGKWAPAVPVGTDLAIAVFSGADLVLARMDMRPWWVRLVPWALTAATVYLNVSGQATLFGKIAHAVFPCLWVVAVALASHVIRVRAHLATGKAMDPVPAARWLLAPVSTARLKRRMILWEIRSYTAALERERERVLALTALQDKYGAIAWRWRAPRRERALFRLGVHAPMPAQPPTGTAAPAAPPDRPAGQAAGAAGPEPQPAPSRSPAAAALTPEIVAEHFKDQIARGELPSGKQIRNQWHIGSTPAGKLRDGVEALVERRRVAVRAAEDSPIAA